MSSLPLPLDIPPGVIKSATPSAAQGRYTDCQHVRFPGKFPEKMGGWEMHSADALDGEARGMIAWLTQAKIEKLNTGTWRKLYAIQSNSAVDITPLESSGTLGADPFTTTNGDDIVTVTHTGHTRVAGAIVHFSGADAVAGITIDGAYEVVEIIDPDNYTIQHSAAANADATGGGAAVDYEYEINPGQRDATIGVGVGVGPVGDDTVGTPRDASSGGFSLEMRYWAFSRYGSEMMCAALGASIYLWDEPSGASRAVVLTNAPASVRYAFVTAERYIFALGASTPMTVKWPDINDPTNWTPALDNTANTRVLQEGNRLMAGCVFNDAVNLIWSDTAVFVAQFLPDSDFQYDIAPVKARSGLIAQGAFAVTPIGVMWASSADMLLYNGSVDTAPRFDEVRAFFFRDLRRDKAHKIAMEFNAKKNEVQIHYCSHDSDENDSYLVVSLDTWSWAPGRRAGDYGVTALASQGTAIAPLFCAHADLMIYEHDAEGVLDADGVAIEAFIESGIVALNSGLNNMTVLGYEPDFARMAGDVTLKVQMYDRPRDADNDDALEELESTLAPTTKLADLGVTGRYARFRLTSDAVGGDFRLGRPVFELVSRGPRR